MKLSKSKLSKLHNKKAQTRKQRLVKKKQKERQRGGKKPKSILKTKRKYSRPFNLRYKTLRNIQKRKRDRKHNNPRKIRFLLKGGQEDQTTKTNTGIELTPFKKEKERVPERKSENVNSQSKALSISPENLARPILSHRQKTSKKKVNDETKDDADVETKDDAGDETKDDAGDETKDDADVETKEAKRKAEEEAKRKAKEEAEQKAKEAARLKAKESSIDEPDCGPGTEKGKVICEKIKGCHYTEDDECLPLSHQIAIDENKKKQAAPAPPVAAPPAYKQAISTTPSTEPVRTTMSTDENDDYKIITVKVYYPKKALTNVISDSGNSAAQTLNVLTNHK